MKGGRTVSIVMFQCLYQSSVNIFNYTKHRLVSVHILGILYILDVLHCHTVRCICECVLCHNSSLHIPAINQCGLVSLNANYHSGHSHSIYSSEDNIYMT